MFNISLSSELYKSFILLLLNLTNLFSNSFEIRLFVSSNFLFNLYLSIIDIFLIYNGLLHE
jgi:hypothetical protein